MKIALSLALSASLLLGAEDLGLIHVDSTTIDDRFEARKTEVSSIAEISGEKVDNSHVENIQQVLQSVPGLTTEYSGGDTLKIHIRGIENQVYMGERPGVAIVIDGVPVFERTGKVNIDIDNIESIKVIKGGASYLFGDDALSGAVVITTKRGAKAANNYATIEHGSFNYQKVVARTGYSDDDFSAHIQASQRKGDGYWEDSDYDTKYVNGKFQYYIDDTSDVTFGFEKSTREKDSHGTVKGVTQAANNPESKDDGSGDGRDYVRFFDVDLTKLYATYAKDFSDNSNFLASIYQYSDTTDYKSAPFKYDENNVTQTGNDDYTTKNHYEQVQRGLKAEYRTASTDLATMTGLDLRMNEYKNHSTYILTSRTSKYSPVNTAGTVKSNDTTDENVYAAYGEVKKAVNEELTVTANARYDVLTYNFVDSLSYFNRKKAFRVPSFRLGATYQLDNDNALYTNASSGFRTPTIQQMFSGDLDVYGAPSENNPNLKPEQAYNFEVGIRGKRDWFDFDATAFVIERTDYILSTIGQYTSGALGSVPASRYENIGGVRNMGIELSLKTDNQKPLFFNLAYSYIRAKFTKYDNYYQYLYDPDGFGGLPAQTNHFNLTGNTVPRVPKHQLNLTANYRANQDLLFTGEMNAKSNYYADEMNQFVMPGYAEFNLLATYAKKIGDYNVQFFGRIDNLMDKQHFNTARTNGDSNQDGSYNGEDISITVNPGRVFTVGVSATF